MTEENIINHWVNSSDSEYKTMLNLRESKDFHWALFIGHIVLEKLLKASVYKRTLTLAPFTHNLLRLAEIAKLNPTDELKRGLTL